MQDVADHCGVSIATVSRALRDVPLVSDATRTRIRAVAHELGYEPSPSAASLASGRHRAVAVAAPPLGAWFFTQAIRGVESVLIQRGYTFFLIDTAVQPDGSRRPFSRSVVEKRSDAVVALGIELTDQEREDLTKVGKPVLIVGAAVRGLSSIGIDDLQASTWAMRHLLELGHRRIAHLGGENDYGIENAVAVARRDQWAASLRAADIQPEPQWFASADFTMPDAKRAAIQLLTLQPRPTAIFAASDEMAFGVLLAARDLGLAVPDELSVISIDDHAWSESFGLSTIRQDPFAQGALAADLILEQVAAPTTTVESFMAPIELILRGSTGPVPDHA